MNLRELMVGQSASIVKINTKGVLKQRFIDMGLTKGTVVTVTKIAPLGDPIELDVRGYNLSIRKGDAETIEIEVVK